MTLPRQLPVHVLALVIVDEVSVPSRVQRQVGRHSREGLRSKGRGREREDGLGAQITEAERDPKELEVCL
jgi:hypothetical protein